jgi:serine/threonine protein phosphatase PrpC
MATLWLLKLHRKAQMTDVGRVRRRNEDAQVLHVPGETEVLRRSGILLAVAGGVGGVPDGDVASRSATQRLLAANDRRPARQSVEERLRSAVQGANTEVLAKVWAL